MSRLMFIITLFLVVIFLLTYNNNSLVMAIAQGNNNTTNIPNAHMDKINSTSSSGLNMTGTINSLVPVDSTINNTTLQGYILSGKWRLNEVNGTVKYFKANITMIKTNGDEIHNHLIAFKTARLGVSLLDNSSEVTAGKGTSISLHGNSIEFSGLADIITNGVIQWRDVPTSVSIFNNKVLSIKSDPNKVDKHFQDVPIYGLVTN